MPYIAYCNNENGASHFADRDRCCWQSRYKFHKKENAERAASRHRCIVRWEGWGYHTLPGASTMHIHGNVHWLKKKKWGDKT